MNKMKQWIAGMVWCENQKGVRRLPTREQILTKTIQRAERKLLKLPKGRVSHQKGNIWRYRGPEKITILHDNDPLLQDLIFRAYLERLVRAAEQELGARNKYYDSCPEVKMEEVFDNLSKYRQVIIEPFVPSQQQFVENWRNQKYPSRNPIPLDDKFPTGVDSCPYVRSKSEILEVRGMDKKGVIFLYEFPLTLTDVYDLPVTIYPDFTILNQRSHTVMYWEHFGRMDDPKYLNDFKTKQELYARNGIMGTRLYQTFEMSNRPLTMNEVDAVIADIKRAGG